MRTAIRLVILGVMAAGLAATVILAVLYTQYGADFQAPNTETAPYTIGVWDGRLAVFESGASSPAKLYDVSVSALPSAEQKKLRAGIAVTSTGELQALLEDYTS